jgi:hypothetical protein
VSDSARDVETLGSCDVGVQAVTTRQHASELSSMHMTLLLINSPLGSLRRFLTCCSARQDQRARVGHEPVHNPSRSRSSRIRPANDQETSRNGRVGRVPDPQVTEQIRVSVQVEGSTLGTLSRWRHGFKSRWDHAGQRSCPGLTRASGPALAPTSSSSSSLPTNELTSILDVAIVPPHLAQLVLADEDGGGLLRQWDFHQESPPRISTTSRDANRVVFPCRRFAAPWQIAIVATDGEIFEFARLGPRSEILDALAQAGFPVDRKERKGFRMRDWFDSQSEPG